MGLPCARHNPTLANHLTRDATLGQEYLYEGETYMYVQFKDAVTYVAKQAVTWDDRATNAVTNDISGSEDKQTLAGLAMRVMTEDYYGYILRIGRLDECPKAAGDDTILPQMPLVPHLTTDGTLASYDDIAASTAGNPTTAELVAWFQDCTKVCCWAVDTSDDPNDTVDVWVNACS